MSARGAYLIFGFFRGAVIREGRLFEGVRLLSFHHFSRKYIPLISRVRGPYGKLWTEFFPSFYGPNAKRAGHENKEGKNEDP